jgi:hypothetical protein
MKTLGAREAHGLNAGRSGNRKRPFGVTILAFLQVVSGIQLLVQALILFAFAAM